MNRPLSFALFFAALPFAALQLHSQTPSDAPADAAGIPLQYHGSGERFGGGMGMHRLLTPITGAPYAAQITTSSAMTLQDGTLAQHSEQRTLFRDTQGRVREEVTLPPLDRLSSDRASRREIILSDPVARTVTRLDPERKIAEVRSLRQQDSFHPGMRVHHDFADRGHVGQNTVTSLGTRTIAGLTASGTRTSHTLPVLGAREPQTVTRTVWFSPDLQIDLSTSETDPIHGTRSMLVDSIIRTDPDAALFQVPSDYTVQQAPPRGTLPRTALPMGHGPVIAQPPAIAGPGA